MKKFFFIFLVTIAFLAISCTEDYTDPKVLSGTTWRCSSFPDDISVYLDYVELKFVSTSQVTILTRYKDGSFDENDEIATYTISGKTITIFDPNPDFGDYVGEIDNSKMNLLVDGIKRIFIKQ